MGIDVSIPRRRTSFAAVAFLAWLNLLPAAPATELPMPAIRLNQLGFQTVGPKRAILVSAAEAPLAWSVLDADGQVRAQGETRVFGENRGSGEHVHLIDFGALRTPGTGYRLIAGTAQSWPFVVSDTVYSTLKYDALAYFYHSRSGIPVEAKYVKDASWARPAGHAPDTATCFDGQDRRGNSWPGCNYRLDATGGWYDAGDQGKYVVNAGIAVWTLLNYYERTRHLPKAARDAFADGRVSIPERGNGVNDLLDEVRWELRFILAMQAPPGAKVRLPRMPPDGTSEFVDVDVAGMAHHKLHDGKWTPLPTAPHQDTQPRYLYPPSTTATLNLAANGAQCARIWASVDREFSRRCLLAAERAFAAAEREPNRFPVDSFDGGGSYGDNDASDEFYWAAAELFITTGKDKYRDVMRASRHFLSAPQDNGTGEISWRSTSTLGTISLALVPNRLPRADVAAARANIVAAADRYVQQAQREGYAIPLSAEQYVWGSNAVLLNHALLLGVAYDLTHDAKYRDRVVDALDYVLGRNPLDQSYVTGYGVRPVHNPHHRFWAHELDGTFPSPPPGVLSGGPNSTVMTDPVARTMRGHCLPQTCWQDEIRAFTQNEVAINWNAPLFWVAAFVDEPRQ
jgi:endoglucanase